jgi:predicted phage baseplate assembly protein
VSDNAINSCGCCGTTAPAPKAPENRPGLPALAYRLGMHAQFKAAMLAAIATRPKLVRLTTRADDDPAIALLDGWATVLDVLAFYQERIANEGYLRTATERRSVLELARSIGYELRPGVAASAYLAFTLETAKGAPLEAKVPKGTKVQSVPGQDEKPQLFETMEELQTRAEWNEMKVRQTQPQQFVYGETAIFLQGVATNLKTGDALLIIGDERLKDPGNKNWDFRRVKAVTTVPAVPPAKSEESYTIVTVDRGLGTDVPHRVDPTHDNPKVYALRQRAALFGHNAPDWRTMPNTVKAGSLGLPADASVDPTHREWPDFTIAGISDPPTEAATGTGLYAEYFSDAHLRNRKLARTDRIVNFHGEGGGADPLFRGDHFSVRWTGWVQPKTSGDYTFTTRSDDGVRLWVDGQPLINQWQLQAARNWSGSLRLEADRKYDLKLEYYEWEGAAVIELWWSGPGVSQELIPTSRLYPRDIHDVHLDAVYPQMLAGSWAVLSIPEYQEVYRVETVAEDARTHFTLTTKTSRLTLKGERLRELFNERVRDTSVFIRSEELPMAERRRTDSVYGRSIELDRPVAELARGRSLIVSGHRIHATVQSGQKLLLVGTDPSKTVSLQPGDILRVTDEPAPQPDGRQKWSLVDATGMAGTCLASPHALVLTQEDTATTEFAVVEASAKTGKTPFVITLKDPLRYSYVRDTVRILGNVVLATHGETRGEVLGSGDAGQTFQKFELKQTPLTRVPTANASGEESTLEVRIDDVLWREVPSLFGRGSKDRCYVTRRADDGKTTVEFGDGRTGARPPTGLENIRATYRVGLGLAGVLPAGRLSLLMTRPLGVKSVTNPLPSAGGDDPEPRDQARQNAPFTVRTLDRIVSLRDFEDFARTFAGIGKVQADWVWSGSRRVVLLTVAGADGKTLLEGLPPLTNLRDAIQAAREPTQPAQVVAGTLLRFTVQAKVLLKDGFLQDKVSAAVRAKLLDAFSFDRRAFGQGVAKSEVLAVIQGVEGVKAVDLDVLDVSDGASRLETLLPAFGARWSAAEGRILPAELLTLAAEGIDLKEMMA